MHKSESYIRKTIGWALRQYSYVDGNAVFQFVKDNKSELSTFGQNRNIESSETESIHLVIVKKLKKDS